MELLPRPMSPWAVKWTEGTAAAGFPDVAWDVGVSGRVEVFVGRDVPGGGADGGEVPPDPDVAGAPAGGAVPGRHPVSNRAAVRTAAGNRPSFLSRRRAGPVMIPHIAERKLKPRIRLSRSAASAGH